MGGKSWDENENAKLRAIYAGKESIKLRVRAELPGRTYGGAKNHAIALGIVSKRHRGHAGRVGYSVICAAIESALCSVGGLTVNQLAKRIGSSRGWTYKVLCNSRGSKFRVGEWIHEAATGNLAAVWVIGAGPDARKPTAVAATKRSRKWRAARRVRDGKINPFSVAISQVAA
jgi:hypothetical protein